MKVNYGKYTYYLDNGDNNTYTPETLPSQYANIVKPFNGEEYDKLQTEGDYERLANYLEQYRFNDPAKDKSHISRIEGIKRQGRISSAIHSRLDDTDRDAINFYESVFKSGGLNDKTDQYTQSFNNSVAELGSIMSNGQIVKKAESIAVTFDVKDKPWYQKNNDNNIDSFCQSIGLDKVQLSQQQGVNLKYDKNSGKTTLIINKSAPMANYLIYNLPSQTGHRNYDMSDNISVMLGNSPITIKGIDEDGNELDYTYSNQEHNDHNYLFSRNLSNIKSIVDDCSDKQTEAYKKLDTTKVYSSIYIPDVDDVTTELIKKYNGDTSSTEFKREWEIVKSQTMQVLEAIGTSNYQIYSDGYNENSTDETMRPIDNDLRKELWDYINSVDKKDLSLGYMSSDGEIGACVTVKPNAITKIQQGQFLSKIYKNSQNGKTISIFIPGLFTEQAQEKINANPYYRAAQEINDMQDYGYSYKLRNGNSITATIDGAFVDDDGNWLYKDDAQRLITKDMTISDARKNLKYKYLSATNNFAATPTDRDAGIKKFVEESAKLSIASGNEIYPNIPIAYVDGTKMTINDLFSYMGDGCFNGDHVVDPDNHLTYELKEKANYIFDIYKEIMKDIQYYKK